MSGTNAKSKSTTSTQWFKWVGIGSALLAVAIVCGCVRYFMGSNVASAQQRSTASQSPFGNRTTPKRQPQRSTTPTRYVMAVVNGKEITRRQLATACFRRYGETVLETMVNKHLILAECERKGVVITQQQVDDEVARLAAQFKLSPDRWLEMLETKRDVKPHEYKNDIIWPRLAMRRIAREQTQVSEEEINKGMETEFGERVRVRLISVTNRAKADQLRAAAAANPDEFGKLAKEHSEDNSAGSWGYIPPIRAHQGKPEIHETVFSLKKGEVSQVVAIAPQYFIFYCEGRVPATIIPPKHLADARNRVTDRIRESKLEEVSGEIFDRLQKEAKVVNVYNSEELRKKYPGVAALIGKRQITVDELGAEALHRNGKIVLEGMISRELLNQELQRSGVKVTDEDIRAEIVQAADRYGFIDHRDGANVDDGLRKWLIHKTKTDNTSVEVYTEDEVWPSAALKKLVGGTVKVTDEDLRKGFEANYGERVNAMAIVCDDMRQALQVFDLARRNNTEKFFGELAQQYSTEPISRNNNGIIPPIQQFGGQPDVEKVAFALKPGELSGIIETGGKSIILRCLGRTEPVVTDFNAVKDELTKDIHEKKLRRGMMSYLTNMYNSAQIDNMLAGTTQRGAEPRYASTDVANRMPFQPNRRR